MSLVSAAGAPRCGLARHRCYRPASRPHGIRNLAPDRIRSPCGALGAGRAGLAPENSRIMLCSSGLEQRIGGMRMASDREPSIRSRAYELWERDGRPDGREHEHWDRAAREIENEARKGGDVGAGPRITTADDPTRGASPSGGGSGFSGAQSGTAPRPSGEAPGSDGASSPQSGGASGRSGGSSGAGAGSSPAPGARPAGGLGGGSAPASGGRPVGPGEVSSGLRPGGSSPGGGAAAGTEGGFGPGGRKDG